MADVIILVVIAGALACIVRKKIKDKSAGKSGCGCGCSGCSGCGTEKSGHTSCTR